MSKFENGNTCGVKHGCYKKPIYWIWVNMRSRCYRPTATGYKNYGGRGITVCDEWRNNFQAFYDWAVENGYADGLSIERINVNDGYMPSNCKWILKTEQAKNTRRTCLITYNKKTQCLEDWCKELNLKSNTICHRAKLFNGDYYKALFEYKKYHKNDKEFCVNGHEYTEENSGYNRAGYRYCKKCEAERREKCNQNRRKKSI